MKVPEYDYDAVSAAALRCQAYAAELGQGSAAARQHGADIELILHFMQTGLDRLIAHGLRLAERATELECSIDALRAADRRPPP